MTMVQIKNPRTIGVEEEIELLEKELKGNIEYFKTLQIEFDKINELYNDIVVKEIKFKNKDMDNHTYYTIDVLNVMNLTKRDIAEIQKSLSDDITKVMCDDLDIQSKIKELKALL